MSKYKVKLIVYKLKGFIKVFIFHSLMSYYKIYLCIYYNILYMYTTADNVLSYTLIRNTYIRTIRYLTVLLFQDKIINIKIRILV